MGVHTGVRLSVLGGSVFDLVTQEGTPSPPGSRGRAWYRSSAELPEALGWDKEETGSHEEKPFQSPEPVLGPQGRGSTSVPEAKQKHSHGCRRHTCVTRVGGWGWPGADMHARLHG